jgi:hypothetical protein
LLESLESKMMERLDQLLAARIAKALEVLPAPSATSRGAATDRQAAGAGANATASVPSVSASPLLSQLAKSVRGRVATPARVQKMRAAQEVEELESSDEEGDFGDVSAAGESEQEESASSGALEASPLRFSMPAERVAPEVLAQTKLYGSLVGWVRVTEWKHQRNKNEAAAIAEAVDVLLAEGLSK